MEINSNNFVLCIVVLLITSRGQSTAALCLSVCVQFDYSLVIFLQRHICPRWLTAVVVVLLRQLLGDEGCCKCFRLAAVAHLSWISAGVRAHTRFLSAANVHQHSHSLACRGLLDFVAHIRPFVDADVGGRGLFVLVVGGVIRLEEIELGLLSLRRCGGGARSRGGPGGDRSGGGGEGGLSSET